jgi:hypothetical protein
MGRPSRVLTELWLPAIPGKRQDQRRGHTAETVQAHKQLLCGII